MPGVPTNTRAPSVAGDHVAPPLAIAPVDLDKVNENLEMPADVLHGEPTFVPSNTPAGTIVGSPRSHYGPLKQGLSQIPEGIEQLPPSHCGSYLSEGARSVTSEPAGHYDFAHEGEITIGMPITPTGKYHSSLT